MPARLNLMYDFQLSNGLLIPPQTLFAILVLLAMGLFIILLAPKNRLAAFAVFWFLANLLVESSVIPLEIIFEHRMYVPSMFLILAAVSWVYWFLDTRINGARIAIIFLVVILSVITWQRNKIWQNEISLWTDVVKKNPYLVKGYVNLGNAFGKNGDDVQAEMYYRKAIALKPNDEKAYLNLGTALKSQKRYEEALSSYSRAVALGSGNSVQLHNNLSHLYMELQQYSEAVQHAQEALKIDRYNYNAIFNLGTAYFKSGKFKQAQSVFLNALELYPDNSDFYLRLGATFENQGKLQEAIESLNKVIELHDTNLARAYNMLGIIYWRQKKYDDSVASAKKSLAIDPGLLDAYVTLGITYEEMGYQDMAFDQFRKAWQQGLDMVGLFNSWALNFLRMNNPDKAILYLQEAINLQPDHIASHENLGIAFQKKGMLKEAQIEKNKARQLQEH
jgi:tetratricopeptide (TPR) repeat protein